MKDKTQFLIEVEVMGKETWVMELPGQHFNSPYYDFTACKEAAKRYETCKDAEAVCNRISPVYIPTIRMEKS